MDATLAWIKDAKCHRENLPSSFFFEGFERGDAFFQMHVRNICENCPVNIECLAMGIETKSSGIWGGIFLENGREKKRRKNKKKEKVA